MANTVKLKRGSGSDPSASDMVVGEPVIRTDTAELFFKKDDGSVAKVSGGGGGPDFKYLALRNAANNGSASYPGNDFTLVTSGTTNAITPAAANTLLVSYGGVIQKPNSGTSTSGITGFIVDGSRFKTATNLAAAPDFILYQESGGIGEPSDGTVTEAKLSVSNNPTNGYFLSAQSGNTGGLTWAAVDLSAYLPLAGGTITGDTTLANTKKVIFNHSSGAGAFIKHQSGHFEIISSVGNTYFASAGTLYLRTNGSTNALTLDTSQNATFAGTATFAGGTCNGSFTVSSTEPRIYLTDTNNNSDFEIRNVDGIFRIFDSTNTRNCLAIDSAGAVSVAGTGTFSGTVAPSANATYNLGYSSQRWNDIYMKNDMFINEAGRICWGDGNELQIYHNGVSSYLDNNKNHLYLRNNVDGDDGGNIYLQAKSGEQSIICSDDQGVGLYFDNALKFETSSSGASVLGSLYCSDHINLTNDGKYIAFGDSSDLKIWHTSTNSLIKHEGNGNLYMDSYNAHIYIRAGDGNTSVENSIVCNNNAGVDVYHSGSKVFETLGNGVRVQGGIMFGSDTADANRITDYEEGSWTPDFFYHSSVSNVYGHYTKIGRMVYAYFTGVVYSAASDTQYISNLPFTTANIGGGVGGVARGYQNFDIQDGPIYYVENNSTQMTFYKDNGSPMPASDCNGHSFRGMVVYTAAS